MKDPVLIGMFVDSHQPSSQVHLRPDHLLHDDNANNEKESAETTAAAIINNNNSK